MKKFIAIGASLLVIYSISYIKGAHTKYFIYHNYLISH